MDGGGMDDDSLSVDDDEAFRRWADIFVSERQTALVCSLASLCCSFLQCVFYLYFSTLRRTPGWLIFRGAVCDMVNSLILLLVFSYPNLEKHELNAIFSVTTVFQVAAYALRAFVYMYLLSIYRNPFQPERHRALYHVFVMCCASLALAVLSAATTPLSKLAMGLFVMPFGIFVVIGGSVHATVRMLVFLSRDRPGDDVESGLGGHSHIISCLARQRVAQHGMAYYLLYGAPLVLGLACTVALKCRMDKPALTHLTVMLATGRPVLSFIGWIAINDVLFKMCGVCSNKRRLHPPQTLPLLSDLGRRLTRRELAAQKMVQGIEEKGFKEELRFELLYSVARGLGQLARDELHGGANQRRTTRTAAKGGGGGGSGSAGGSGAGAGTETGPASSFHIELVSTPEASSNGQKRGGSADLSRKSRSLSFLMPSAFSSLGSPRMESSMADAPSAPRDSEIERKTTPPSKLLEQLRWCTRAHQDSDDLTVSTSSEGALVRTKSRGETWVMRMRRRTGEERLKVVHYSLDDFRAIRDAFGISRSSYAASFPNDLTELASDWRAKLKESVSEGASGCFFYHVLTPTGSSGRQMSRLIVKQIAEPEKSTLMKILPAYRRHVEQQKGKSFICYLGCHAIPLSWTFSRKVYFVVMRNFLPANMWLTFDLKGATANRRVLDEETLFKRSDSSAESRGPRSYGTLRDWEWLDMAMAVDVSARDRAELASIICEDSAFLGAQGLLDYSLLLGIHRIPQGLTGDERREHMEALVKAGGYVSLDRQKVYFFGIIDVLERYTVRWKAQHALLKAGYHLVCRGPSADGISAMSPLEYAERFRTFVLQEVLQIDCRSSQVRSFGLTLGELTRSEERWAPLWESRRRGLVRERIEAATQDHTQSTEELGRQASRWARRIEELEAALRANGIEPPGPAPSESERSAIRLAAGADHRLRGSTSV
eukprot:CAMPEP_0170283266 /NCGR_PEP_ID=MMETSP0116_2-20130129/41665_1 /TAXON_ID=400756 /ORGANISM="Durinskia baltica, Strain CSIRO CS-38" /LENGTH=940 /DNA_ID=CAMNT_0010534633 /DNA_START=3 /DNA_END=2821 /DNA_ORIENTATION=+